MTDQELRARLRKVEEQQESFALAVASMSITVTEIVEAMNAILTALNTQ